MFAFPLSYLFEAVENLYTQRQRLEWMTAIYFMQPTEKNIKILLNDFAKMKKRQYKAVHVYFTSRKYPTVSCHVVLRSIAKYYLAFTDISLNFPSLHSHPI
jgi:predicted metal-dependent RNase